MDALILAAGYATRLYPLTLTKAKPLLEVAGKPMIDHVLEALAGIQAIERVIVVSNAKFSADFEAWAASCTRFVPIIVLNDGSTDPKNALGAIGDLQFTRQKLELSNDLLVAAGDNLFSESLADFGKAAVAHNAPLLGVYDVGNLELIKQYNDISVDADGRITNFEEKPKNPTGTLTGIALYYYPRHTLPLIETYIAEGNNADQPGRLIQWLYPRTPVYTWRVPGIWFDIGGQESLDEANRVFSALPTARS